MKCLIFNYKMLSVLAFLLIQSEEIGAARFSVIQTGSMEVPEALVFEGGKLTKLRSLVHSAFLIHSNGEYLLFETGLGNHLEEQKRKSIPWWKQWLFPYNRSKSVADWLRGEIKISKIFLSHTHWDHAGGIQDFPGSKVYFPSKELEAFKQRPEMGRFPVQIDLSKVEVFPWKKGPFIGFSKYFDVFGDKEVVFVPLPGHTPGSIGLYLKTAKHEFLFVGDAVWAREQVEKGIPKSFLASSLMDADRKRTLDTIKKLRKIFVEKELVIVPTHDGAIQEDLRRYPEWNE